MQCAESKRVLHVVGGLDRGGIETWLMHVLRRTDRARFRMDFLVHTDRPGAYDDEVRAFGCKVLSCPAPQWTRPWRYGSAFRRLLAEHGPYDVVHSHVHHYSGNVLRLAHAAGVPVRIAHSHIDTSVEEARARFLRGGYLALMRRWIARHATAGLAASRPAAANLFGRAWESDPRWRVLYYGIDPAPFHIAGDRAAVRAELGVPAGAFVLGHVGRFHEQKNHAFLIDIAAEVVRRLPEAHLLLVGIGALRPAIEHRVAQAGLTRHVTFAGARPDVPRLMRDAMDVFVFPSLWEGLPVAGIEAQAAGLPCLFADGLTPELDRVGSLVRRLSLDRPASAWADAVLAVRQARPAVSPTAALAAVEESPFNIRRSGERLEEVYCAS
jgi:glycosyltransferase involved in cell wall biosynthesis